MKWNLFRGEHRLVGPGGCCKKLSYVSGSLKSLFMKPGDLVICIHDINLDPWRKFFDEKFPVKDKVYTVRGIQCIGGNEGIVLDEIVNPVRFFGEMLVELHFWTGYFRKIDYSAEAIAHVQHATETV